MWGIIFILLGILGIIWAARSDSLEEKSLYKKINEIKDEEAKFRENLLMIDEDMSEAEVRKHIASYSSIGDLKKANKRLEQLNKNIKNHY